MVCDSNCGSVDTAAEFESAKEELTNAMATGEFVETLVTEASAADISDSFTSEEGEGPVVSAEALHTDSTPTISEETSYKLPDVQIDPSDPFNFDHCASDFEGTPDECGFAQSYSALNAFNQFNQCTDWKPTELIPALVNSVVSFQEVIQICAPGGGGEGGRRTLLHAPPPSRPWPPTRTTPSAPTYTT